jgi:hypothetical protein
VHPNEVIGPPLEADIQSVDFLRSHLLAAGIVAVAVAAAGAVLAFARPTAHPYVIPPPPDHGLPYTVVSYTAADVRRAFAAEGIRLTPRSQFPTVTTIGNRDDILEVDAFGDRKKVEQSGFWDYAVENGKYVHFPRVCGSTIPDAERWHGNVRVIVKCRAAGAASGAWLRRVDRALARL